MLVRLRGEGGTAEIAISDNGPGISAERQREIFERFDRSDLGAEEARPTGDGRGFGLPLARQLVEAQGGTLTLVSEEGAGTTVTIRLPLVAEERAA